MILVLLHPMPSNINILNKKARHEYILLDNFIAGVMLTGTEIKSVRNGKVSLREAYCTFKKNELYIINMNIAEYSHGNIFNHEPKRDRKLLLSKRELKKLRVKTNEKGFTIVPVRMFINERGLAKIEIALAQGKKLYDKRESLKEKDHRNEISNR